MGMSLKQLAIFAGGILLTYAIGSGGGSWLLLPLWLLGYTVAYVASCWLHPRRNCWTCNGRGREEGWLFDYGRRACLNCDGSGWQLRWGAERMGFTGDSPLQLRRSRARRP